MLVYSLAAPRRTTPDGKTYSSVLKTQDKVYTNKTIDLKTNTVSEVTISPATEDEVFQTIKVMGGEDWKDWIQALKNADVLDEHFITVAYSYIGPELTHPIYKNGSIGMAKAHLYRTAKEITEEFPQVNAYISVNKALVTQSSAAIPIVPLYISILYKVMKEKQVHEGCIEQMYRLFHDKLFGNSPVLDSEGMIRLDDLEMQTDIQSAVENAWNSINTENLKDYADISGYWEDFFEMFGFGIAGIDYKKDTDIQVQIPSID